MHRQFRIPVTDTDTFGTVLYLSVRRFIFLA